MAETVTMPKLGFDMAEGTLVRWVKKESQPVKKGDVLAEIETDKATVEVEAHVEGVVLRHLVPEGTSVPVGDPIAVVGAPGEPVEAAAPPAEARPAPAAEEPTAPAWPAPPPEPKKGDGRLPGGVRASPVARRLADESGVDLRQVSGSGPGGRITRRDVEAAIARPAPPAKPAAPPPAREARVEAKTRLRQIIGRRMAEAKRSVPHFYVTADFDLAPTMALRSQLNALLPEEQKLSVNDFVVKATALALRQFPSLNASVKGDELTLHGAINIGIAVAVEGGLLTVVVRDADRKSLAAIAAESKEMVGRARAGKVRPEDVEGSTFTVSNLGMFQVDEFMAIINPPEVGILAVGSVQSVPVVKDGQLAVGTRMKATISADHRATDGAEAARFLQELRKYVEEPLRLVM